MISTLKKPLHLLASVFLALFLGLLLHALVVTTTVWANSSVNIEEFNPGRIIDDAVFTKTDTMSVSDIQQFLEETLPGGICNRYKENTYSTRHQPPYTCPV